MVKMILFDLDGTLLPMDQDRFIKGYFGFLAKKLIPYGYDKEELIKNIWNGTRAMVLNDGKKKNIDVFWDSFREVYGDKIDRDKEIFEDFYNNEFEGVRDFCGYNKESLETIDKLKKKGYRLALATNPIFPRIATEKRLAWTGIDKSNFELMTYYENSSYSKPNTDYFLDVSNRLGVSPEECLMVGNDVDEDMVAGKIGMKVFLVTDCLINKKNLDISKFPQGSFKDLISYIEGENF